MPAATIHAHRGGRGRRPGRGQLYGLAPDEFTAARNAAVKAAKDGGDTRASAAIKALRKPTQAAWLAKQLVRTDPDGTHDLTELGEQLRAAHLAADGPRLRQLTEHRHRLVQNLVTTARDHAASLGQAVRSPVAERLTEALDAALVDPGAAQLLRTGQLTSALRHVGFGVVDETGEPAKLTPVAPRIVRRAPAKKAPAKPVTKQPAKRAVRADTAEDMPRRRRAELQARAAELQAAYDEAQAARAAAESALDAHQHHLADLEQTIQRLTEELEHARDSLRAARRDTRRLQRLLAIADRDATGARRQLEAGRQRLANVED